MRDLPHRGVILTVGAVGLIFVIGGIARWQPLAMNLATAEFPTPLAFVTVGAWFLVSTLTSIPKPYYGLWLVAGSIVALPLILGFLGAAAGGASFRPVSLALAVFTGAGVLIMNAARSETKKEHRPAWLAVAWPGIVIVVVSSALIAITVNRPVPRVNHFYVPGTMLPAERGP